MTKLNLFTRLSPTIMRYLILLFMLTVPLIALAATEGAGSAEPVVTLDQAVQQVKQNKQGKVLAAETKQTQGSSVHIIKVLTNEGRVKKIRIKSKQNQWKT